MTFTFHYGVNDEWTEEFLQLRAAARKAGDLPCCTHFHHDPRRSPAIEIGITVHRHGVLGAAIIQKS